MFVEGGCQNEDCFYLEKLGLYMKNYLGIILSHNWHCHKIVFLHFMKVILLIKTFACITKYRSSYPEMFLGKGALKICCKFTGEHPCQSGISINLLLKSYFGMVFFCKFTAYFQNTFS